MFSDREDGGRMVGVMAAGPRPTLPRLVMPPGWLSMIGKLVRQPIDDVLASLERLVTAKNPMSSLVPAMISMLITWFVYVGIHELLHVFGCVAAGGTVSTLEIGAKYGGALYAKLFPFVVTGSEYAGRLSGFDTGGSDWVYMSTVFCPFALTVLFGVALVKLCGRRRRPILFGVAIVVGLAPFYNLQGDYFEMGSIIVTRMLTLVAHGFGQPPMFEALRSDDIFKLLGTLCLKPSELGLTSTGLILAGIAIVMVSFVVDVLLAFLTYWMGHQVSRVFVAPRQKK